VALKRAERGSYGRRSLRCVSPELTARYFESVGDSFELLPRLRRSVDFRFLNLAGEGWPSLESGVLAMDLILCRNVLMYFDAETVQRVAHRLLASLAPDGWLLIGASDPPLGRLVPCEVVVTTAGLAYRPRPRGGA
jgi:chemotaxis protein methyltransferase CheR